jgi:hypothetical protein
MTYDEGPAQRIRERLGERPGRTEKRTCAGPAFPRGGNTTVGMIGDEPVARGGPGARRGGPGPLAGAPDGLHRQAGRAAG